MNRLFEDPRTKTVAVVQPTGYAIEHPGPRDSFYNSSITFASQQAGVDFYRGKGWREIDNLRRGK
jgi:hypothetical protein